MKNVSFKKTKDKEKCKLEQKKKKTKKLEDLKIQSYNVSMSEHLTKPDKCYNGPRASAFMHDWAQLIYDQ